MVSGVHGVEGQRLKQRYNLMGLQVVGVVRRVQVEILGLVN